MIKNKVLLALIAMVGVAALVYSLIAFSHLWLYLKLDQKTPIEWLEVNPKQLDSDRFGVKATFSYLGHKNSQVLQDPFYLNAYGAEKRGEVLLKELTSVWYNPKNPQESSLQKSVPYKELAYAFVLWAILIYFIFLGWRISGTSFKA